MIENKELSKLQEYILLILDAKDGEPVSYDHLKAILFMLSRCVPELDEVMPRELEIFGQVFTLSPKEPKLCVRCGVKPSEIGGYCEECNILAWQERRRARGKDLESEASKNEQK